MDVPEASSKERFSLLLLDPGEIYFEDFAAHYYPANVSEEEAVRRAQRGRIKMCSKSIVFDPKEFHFPILKFPLKDCKKIEQWTGPLLSRIYNNKSTIMIECDQVVEMLENNIIAPFVFKRSSKQYLFSLSYAKVEDCLPQMSQLHRASTLPAADQAAMISAIVQSRQRMVKFDNCWIEDLHEHVVLRTQGSHITPLVTNPGRILLTTLRIYFQPFNNVESLPVFKIKLGDIKRIVKRRYVLRHVGIEIYCSENAPLSRLFLSLKSQIERDDLYNSIISQAVVKLDDTQQENMLIKWQNGCISNYDYLLYLNSMADRTFNDLTQYPVFPWVISNYATSELDLEDPTHFRDLSKPIGALNEERLNKLKARYKEMPAPRFLYGSHYSTPGFVLYYLVRKVPLYMLCLHNGRFDHPDRMFNSISDTWKNVTTNSADFKELTPEFYQTECAGDFLINSNNLNFGVRQDGKTVDDVELPKWAKDHGDCIRQMRAALESEYVSLNLHRWIDLVFGCKQKGAAAEKADNVFYYLTYEGAIDLDSVEDLNDRYSLEVQITEFGQVPRQIFTVPHPQKLTSNLTNSLLIETRALKSVEIAPVHQRGEKQAYTHTWQSMENLKPVDRYKLHKSSISALCLTGDGNYAFSVSHDSMLKMFSLNEKKSLRNINLSTMALSSCILMPGDKTVLVGSWDNCVYMYSIEYGNIMETTTAHDDAVSDIHWNDGILATASWDSTAKIWNYCAPVGAKPFSSATLLAELDHDTKVTCVRLNSDNSKLASGTTDGCIYLWDLATYTVLSKNAVHEGSVNAILISPDDQRVISLSRDIKVLDLMTGTIVFAKDEGDEFCCVCWNGQMAIAGGQSGRLYVWDLKNVQLVDQLVAHKGPVTAIAISSDGTMIASGDESGTIIIWK